MNFHSTSAFLATLCAASQLVHAEIPMKPGDKVAFLGDSITEEGQGYPGGYVQLIGTALAAQGVKIEIIGAGISGHKSDQMLARLDRDVLSKKPQWMTLSCGVNDVWHGARGIPLEDYKNNITSIVDKAQALGVKVIILTSTMIGEDQANENNQKLVGYNAALRTIAAEKKCLLADLNAEMQATLAESAKAHPKPAGENVLTEDGVHMIYAGDVMMAVGILKGIGLNGAEIVKARETWMDTPETNVLNPAVKLTQRQFQQLEKVAATRQTSVNQLIDDACRERVLSFLQPDQDQSARDLFEEGQKHFDANGVPQDTPKALELWKQAAEKGNGRAAAEAAMIYLAGDGVAADPKQALALATRAAELNDPSGLVVLGELQFKAGEIEKARATWTKVAAMKPVGATGQPIQSSDNMAAQQGADLLKLIEFRQRKPESGRFAFVETPHVHQGYNNCGATSSTTFARFQGAKLSAWDFKRLCPTPIGTGTDWNDLLNVAAKIGQRWKLVTFTPDDDGFENATAFLRTELDAGRPLVIDFKFIGSEFPTGEAGHTLGLVGYIAAENLFILCNPAIASPGLQLMTAEDLKKYWRSDHYSALSKGVLSRPAIVIDQ